MRALAVLLVSLGVSHSDSAYQDFWYGGPGTPGPVEYWTSVFDQCDSIYYDFELSIQLPISYSFHWIHSTGPGGNEMVFADTDNDGDLDLVSAQMPWNRISHWENLDGSGLNWARTIIVDSLPEYARSIDSSDIDLDGDVDFFIASHSGPLLIENLGTGWSQTLLGSAFLRINRMGDVEGDGDEDIVSSGPSIIVWWENLDGVGGSWLGHVICTGPAGGILCSRPCDLDGDGDLDAVRFTDVNPELVWYENVDGAGLTWAPHTVCSQLPGEYSFMSVGMEVADMDLDGDEDLVVGGSNALPEGRVLWIENMNGLGTSWQLHAIDNDLSGAYTIAVADLDGDDDPDVMAYSGGDWGERLAGWYENMNGAGTSWLFHLLDDTTWEAGDIASADVDADGDPDVVACDEIAGVRWYEFSRASSGWLESSILDPPGSSQKLWTYLSWEGSVPPGTTVTFQVRASNDPEDMGEWSPELSEPGSIGIYLPDPCYYFQYRVNMTTSAPPSSPLLDKVLVQYDPLGMEGEPEGSEPSLTVLSGNPSPGAVVLDVYLPEPGQTDLRIYDLAGRLVSEPLVGETGAGHHQLNVAGLPSGCYQVVFDCGADRIPVRFLVLR